ncbi:hypothetical protein G6F46_010709 [Rhizopus delemar]|uniref:Yeast cell wall synthesis Kre9/Knh1-like N-terminal domain-containing protein n=3 Tax=Rhizopus TaxID=4842 RepID=I1CRM9_RHIO9|nr:hypothetical protein RO3G_15820 [Rhizopus delemar RA 99-880]KAG1046422.1 hypothetical protein G6F43_011093 [Rhizopus delemar]KAG1536821.1 hypothetical protein G6F51_010744 [Rhizopus arrhizus]KAG1449783.1 hypothetical protein G6F55_010004 [Rhizopus delemar]KAG1504109.1 hypothetical protein G6F53_010469 [Rhizopus delemar]|eukprot:EIE91109.1 hypothetical protein RO3G_15820 [Rhizopus delemar RA 99-880]
MKLSLAALAVAISSVAASNITVIEPWGQTTWTAGSSGLVHWSFPEGAGKTCEIHLLTGEATNATVVANLTANDHTVPCDYTRATFLPLPSYTPGQYFVRIGPVGCTSDEYGYSNYFNYVAASS